MKDYKEQPEKAMYAISITILITALAAIFYLNSSFNSITGFAVTEVVEVEDEVIKLALENITQEQALNAVLQSEQDINEMQEQGFSIIRVNDILREAKKAFEGENYTALIEQAEKINDSDRRDLVKQLLTKAQEVLERGEKAEVNYTLVLEKTNEIAERKYESFLIKDSLRVADFELKELQETGLDVSEIEEILAKAKAEFGDERYEEATALLQSFDQKLFEIRAEATLVRTIYKAGRETTANFVKENLGKIIIAVSVIAVVIILFYNRLKVKSLKNKLRDMQIEQGVLTELIKKAQEEYYSEMSISKQTFEIKVSQYKERMSQIKRELPVVKARLEKLSKGRRLV